jgi:hypothetical protein
MTRRNLLPIPSAGLALKSVASAAAEMGAPRTIMDFMRRLEASPRIAGKKPATQVRAAGKTTEHARRCDGGALLLPAGHADAALPSCQ